MKSLKAKFRKTDTNEWNKNDERLLSAVELGEVDKVTSLLAKKGISAVKLDSEGKSALHVAAARGQTECLVAILSHGVDLSISDSAGLSPLHLAAKNNHPECCKKLIQGKCQIDSLDSLGKTALHHAAASGSVQTVQLLCKQKSLINIGDADGLTPLLLSAQHGHAEVCSLLLDCGAQINVSDNSGRTAVILACENNSAAVVNTLLQREADLSSVNLHGCDVTRGTKLSLNSELQSAPTKLQATGSATISPQHDQVAKPTDERITTPKKRKAPPPPISPLQDNELRRMAQKELQEEKNMWVDTVEGLKKTVEQSGTESGKEQNYDLQDSSQPYSLTSNSSFHLIQDKLELPGSQTDKGIEEEEHQRRKSGSKEEIHLLHQAFESVQVKLFETGEENRSLQVQQQPKCLQEFNVEVRGKEYEAELMESPAALQAKLTDTLERYNQALEEGEELKVQIGLGDNDERRDIQKRALMHEHEVKQLKALLLQLESLNSKCLLQMKHLEESLRRAEEKFKDNELQSLQREDLYKEAQEEIRMLQEALRGTVPVEAAAKDFEDMKGELNGVISGLQRRLLELSHSYSGTKSKLSAAQKQLSVSIGSASPSPTSEQQQEQSEALNQVDEIKACLLETESKYSASQQEMSQLQQEAEKQLDNSVTLTTDHTQVVAALGNAIKNLEKQLESVKEQLQLKTLQLDALQNGFSSNKSSDDSVPRVEHDTLKDQLKREVSHLTQLLQGALRKQDEIALEAADAWQQARNNHAERETLEELMMSREKENLSLSNRLVESQDAVNHLKQLVENHVASEREKNKRINDLSREVCKLKDALNSLSQLSYNSSSPSKRQQQNQQLDTMQQQIKQLQYQLADSKKQHQKIVAVYRMHLLYAAQGQMDEDVQKALKQILMMCKMPSQVKKAC